MILRQKWELLKEMSWWPILAAMVLLIVGVVFIYSAGFQGHEQPVSEFYLKQLRWICIGVPLGICAMLIDYRVVARMSWLWYGITIFLLVLVLVKGQTEHGVRGGAGSRSWLGIGGMGGQPSEPAKIAMALLMSWFLDKYYLSHRQRRSFIGSILIMSVPLLLVLKQPDVGSALVFPMMALTTMFVARQPMKYFIGIFAMGVVLAGLLVVDVYFFSRWLESPQKQAQEEYQGVLPLKNYHRERILSNIKPELFSAREKAVWNRTQSILAVGSGGFSGKGWLKGDQNVLGYLPKSVAPDDFIFSVIAEELGFLGSLLVVGCYTIILNFGVKVAFTARDPLGSFLAVGLVMLLFAHVFINIGMTIGLIPIIGIPLPFLSYGGSFMLSTCVVLGLLQSIYIHRKLYW